MNEIEQIKQDIADMKARNTRVESDKAWETSISRKVAILVLTYVVAVVVLYIIGVSAPYFNALIPTLGFFLSVQSLPFLKKIWIRKHIIRKGIGGRMRY